jgi:hypothetical protein
LMTVIIRMRKRNVKILRKQIKKRKGKNHRWINTIRCGIALERVLGSFNNSLRKKMKMKTIKWRSMKSTCHLFIASLISSRPTICLNST